MKFPGIPDEHPAIILSNPNVLGKVMMVHATSDFSISKDISANIYTSSDHKIFSKPSIISYVNPYEADVKLIKQYLSSRDNCFGRLKEGPLNKILYEARNSDALAEKWLIYLDDK